MTAYFTGAHYEVTDGVVTKYYYAGTQRISMRTNGVLNYLLGDHLGSTSLSTDAAGNVVSELRYKAWGEVRYASGNTPTQYQYTGQYSYASDFGLLFYNARWYDPSLGRFAQADIIVAGGVQGLDRYAYVNNSPINYTDPSGHDPDWCGSDAKCRKNYYGAHGYGIFRNSRLILACGMGTNGACGNSIPIYLDTNGDSHVPMYYTATEFANNGGSYIYMDYSTSGSTDQYAKDIANDIKSHPGQATYLIGHSAGANAVIAGVSILRGKDGKGDTSGIRAIVLLDPYLTPGNGAGTQYPQDWTTLSNLGNQENADKLINDALIPMWVAHSGQQTDKDNFPPSRQPGVPGGAVPFSNDTHLGLAVDVTALQKAIQFFINPSNPSP